MAADDFSFDSCKEKKCHALKKCRLGSKHFQNEILTDV